MTLIDALASLAGMNAPVFETADAAARLSVSNAYASTMLARLATAGHVTRLRRGVWAFADRVDPLSLPSRLTAPLPSYVSLQTALYFHGMISQVPAVTYAVSLARSRRFYTPLGTVSIHHVQASFFFGYEPTGGQGALIASPEKALVDFLYLGPARSRLFRALPELELPRQFSRPATRDIASRIVSPRRREMVERGLQDLFDGAAARRT